MKLIKTFALFLLLASPASAQFTDAVANTLRAERAKYGQTINKAEAATILNAVAWANRADGWVLLGKTGGNHCPQPKTGIAISCDFLVHRQSQHGWDVLVAAPDDDTPQSSAGVNCCGGSWEDLSAALASGARTLVDPVDSGTPPVVTPPVPEPGPPVVVVDPSAIDRLEVRINALEQALAALSAGADAGIKNLEGRINTLDAKPIPTRCVASVWGYVVSCRLQ